MQAVFGREVGPNALSSFTAAEVEVVLHSGPAAHAVVWAVRLAYLVAMVATFPLQARWLLGRMA